MLSQLVVTLKMHILAGVGSVRDTYIIHIFFRISSTATGKRIGSGKAYWLIKRNDLQGAC